MFDDGLNLLVGFQNLYPLELIVLFPRANLLYFLLLLGQFGFHGLRIMLSLLQLFQPFLAPLPSLRPTE
jgi:hypothetical protein